MRQVLIVVADDIPRVLLHAELIERGLHVVAVADLTSGLPFRGGDVIFVDEEAMSEGDERVLELLTARNPRASVLLLASALLAVPPGPWFDVLHRPVTIGGLADAIEEALPDD